MALHVPRAPGFQSMMKDGSRFFSGLEEAVFRNISSCKEFAETVQTCYGPNGMNKMVINHLEKLFVTNDAATIIRELEVEHPAAKLMILGSQMQENEIGDATNFVIIFAGALLKQAEDLIRMGLKPQEVAEGYEIALGKALEVLETLSCYEVKDSKDIEGVTRAMRSAIMSKQYGYEDFLSELITKACVSIMSDKGTAFNVDNVRVCKIVGAGIQKSEVVQGMVFRKTVDSNIIKKENCKIAIYTCPVDSLQTETKGTVLIKTAEELSTFSRGEENMLENQIKAIADSGAGVVVSGGKIGEMAMHFINKYDMMAVRLTSKWDIRRLARATGATALPRMTAPTAEELGMADNVYVDELGDTSIVVFKVGNKESKVSTIVIRGSTDNYMDDIERAIDDGVNVFKGLCKDGRFTAGGGATEIEIAKQVTAWGETHPGLEQYSIKKFGEALEVIPKVLADNSGVKAKEVISQLYAAHNEGKQNVGFDINADSGEVKDCAESHVYDLLLSKHWALKYATNAACTILRVDQIIMAKRAGGPKARDTSGPMDQDDD
jgi:T-complex protein 1 subunit theta